MKRKIFKAAIAVILILTMTVAFSSCMAETRPAAKSADGKIDGTEIFWDYNAETKTLALDGTGAIPSFTSPSEVPWYDVRHGVTKLALSDGITAIGDYAFYYLPLLEKIDLSSSVTSLGKYSFAFCSTLTAATLPDSVTSIGGSCFEGCASLKSVFVPHTVTSIGARAFHSCGALEDAVIMAQITEIGNLTFKNCKSLKTLCFNETQRELTNIAPNAFDGAAINFSSAIFTTSTTGAATLTVKYVFEDGTQASPDYVKEFVRGESYTVESPLIEDYTADQKTLAGTISTDTAITVTYKKNAPVEEAPEVNTDDNTDEKPEENDKITVGTIVALVILVAVIAGIVVLAVIMMRSDKKPANNLKAKNAKPVDNGKKKNKK